MSEHAYLNRKEAAAACGCHVDTIRRAEASGKLPNCRRRDDGTVEIPVADLVAAGLLDPLAAAGPIEEVATRSRTERDLAATRQELAVSRAEVAALVQRLARAEDEVAFLRRLLTKAQVA